MTEKILKRVVVLAVPLVVAAGAASAIASSGSESAVAAAAGKPVESGPIVGGDVLIGGQADGFLKVDGVAAESADPAHLGEIDVKAFGFGGKNSGGGDAGGGAGAGKVTFSTVKFAKLYDSASPKLFQRLATGQHIPSVTFSFRRPGTDGADFLTYKLTDVVVASYDQGGLRDRPLLEQVELSFSKVQISYTPAGGAPITAGWDVQSNTSA